MENLEAMVDMAEAKAVHAEAEMKRAQDALTGLEVEIKDKINAGKDELVDLYMYRVWEHNQDIDISFMEGEEEGLLKTWKARLEEEKELRSMTTGGVVTEADYIGEVSSKELSKSQAALDAEFEALLTDTPEADDVNPAPAQP